MRFLLLFLFISACSGYRYTQQDNPLAQYGINSLSVPMFHNFSNQPNVSGNFTRETYRLLTGFSGLRITSGYNTNADAMLIGIIKSPEKISETLTPTFVSAKKASDAIGDRQIFYIPGASETVLSLQVIVIKRPTEEELALLRSGIGDQVKLTSKVIFNETIPVRGQFTREILDKDPTTGAEAVNVNSTQNEGIKRKTILTMAEQAALNIRDMILYAF